MRRLLLFAFVAALGLASVARAETLRERIIAELNRDGYCRIVETKTLLGRLRIIGVKPDFLREVVLNPRTNEILRDVVLKSDRIGDVCDEA